MPRPSRSPLLALLFLISLACPIIGQAGDFTVTTDVVYGHKAGMALTYDVIRPKEQNGAALLFIVSGGWFSNWTPVEQYVKEKRQTPNLWETAVDKGYTLILVRHGSAPYFKIPDAVSDVRRAVRFIRLHADDYGIDPHRIGVFGFSAGGHLTLVLATTGDDGQQDSPDPVDRVSSRIAAAAPVVAPTKLQDLMHLKERFTAMQIPEDQVTLFSPLLQVTSDDAPAMIIHGGKDDLVPPDHSERLAKAYEAAGVAHDLLIIEGAGHGFKGIELVQMQEAMLNWFDKHLQPQK